MTKDEMLQMLDAKVKQCKKCPVLTANRTQTVFGVGNPNTKVVFLGEAPGFDEDQKGEPFVGKSGKLLNTLLEKCKINRADVYITNICKCRPPNNRAPTIDEANNCRKFLDLQLKVVAPKIIVCLGSVAAQNLLGEMTPISQMRGRWHYYQGIRVICTFHPSYGLRVNSAKNEIYKDLMIVVEELKKSTD